MSVDSQRLASDADFAADYFAGQDVNSAQRKLSQDGAEINLMEVTICLASRVQELRGVGTSADDEAQLNSDDVPESHKEALRLGVAANERAASENEDTKQPETGDENNPAPTPDQPTSSSGITL